MRYIALLRGINVGGNSKVEMIRLKKCFEKLGFTDVKTYINSGNVVFSSEKTDALKLAAQTERYLEGEFGFNIPTLIVNEGAIRKIVNEVSEEWQNDKQQKTDVLFLWSGFDDPKSVNIFSINKAHESLIYINGAMIWNVTREFQNQSKFPKQLMASPIYKNITARNINTVRKLNSMLN